MDDDLFFSATIPSDQYFLDSNHQSIDGSMGIYI